MTNNVALGVLDSFHVASPFIRFDDILKYRKATVAIVGADAFDLVGEEHRVKIDELSLQLLSDVGQAIREAVVVGTSSKRWLISFNLQKHPGLPQQTPLASRLGQLPRARLIHHRTQHSTPRTRHNAFQVGRGGGSPDEEEDDHCRRGEDIEEPNPGYHGGATLTTASKLILRPVPPRCYPQGRHQFQQLVTGRSS